MKKWIPNALTLLNLLAGILAIIALFEGAFDRVIILLLGAAIADFLDGLVARLLRVSSPLGKELDSLADLVSFGVAPGIILYALFLEQSTSLSLWVPAAFPLLILPLFSAIRLAKFNLDDRQTDAFMGLPTPAATLLVVGVLLIYQSDAFCLGAWLVQSPFLYTLAGGLSVLLVVEVPMFSLKFKHWRWQGNQIRYIFAATAVVLILLLREAAIVAILLAYLLINLLRYFWPNQ